MIKPRIDLQNRTKLENVIPLDSPYVLYIDPSSACNFKCSFCYQNVQGSITPKIMDFNHYKKIIDSLSEFSTPIKVIRLYGFGEPLLNMHFSDMVRYAKDSSSVISVDTTTNGALFNSALNRDIIKAGINRINISVQGINAEQYYKFSKYKIDYDLFIRNITHLYKNRDKCEIIIKINGDVISEEDKELFTKIFSPISDGISIEHTVQCWPDFEIKGLDINKSVGIFGQSIEKNIDICPYLFYSLMIQSTGEVSLCFLDWNKKLVIGDTSLSSIKEIWDGNLLRSHQRLHLLKLKNTNVVCSKCEQLNYGMCDNLNGYEEILLERLK